MGGTLGDKIGEGATADIYAWAPGQVMKLFKSEFPIRIGRYEARMTQAAFTAGAGAPEVLGEVTVEGRYGIVLPHFAGPTIRQLLQVGIMEPAAAGVVLASVGLSVHNVQPPPEALPLREYMEAWFPLSGDLLPEPVAAGILALIDRLPPENSLCHCDLHPGNVIITERGPRLIDWTGAKRGNFALDLACSHLLLSELVPPGLGEPRRQRAVNAAMLSEYARLVCLPPEALSATVEGYLPVARAFLVLAGAGPPAVRERLLRSLEADMDRQATRS